MEKFEGVLPPVGTSPVPIDQLKDNALKFNRSTIDPREALELTETCDKIEEIERETKLYSGLAQATGVDADALAGIHYRESDLSMAGCFQNGDRVIGPDAMARGSKTTHVPKGQGPWPTVMASGIDAINDELKSNGWKRPPIGVADTLGFTERYNGMGFRNHGINSSYNWGATSEEDVGGYSNDGEWNPSRNETRLGVVAIMKEMQRREVHIEPQPTAPTPVVIDSPFSGVLLELAKSVGLSDVPVKQMIAMHTEKFSNRRFRYWAVIDFTRRSTEKRMFFFDVVNKKVERHLVAHGAGSDPSNTGMATRFSNTDGSHMSSLGICQGAEIYDSSKFGLALRLDGLESSNSHIRSRAIVMHKADYVNEAQGICGRSWGCTALDPKFKDMLISSLRGGSLINIWKA